MLSSPWYSGSSSLAPPSEFIAQGGLTQYTIAIFENDVALTKQADDDVQLIVHLTSS